MRNRRHTTAIHLLRAGVDINTIRAWLGHVSIDTTNIYAETDVEMKAKALATCEVKETKRSRQWKEDKGLMTFLRARYSRFNLCGANIAPTLHS